MAHARSRINGAAGHQNGSGLKELALATTESGNVVAPGQSTGMAWGTASTEMLNTYRVAHNLTTPAAFTSPYHQAMLTNPGIGRQSPTMARRKEKRRVAKEQLALAVRKNFNSAAVSETDVVVELVYKVRHQAHCKMRDVHCVLVEASGVGGAMSHIRQAVIEEGEPYDQRVRNLEETVAVAEINIHNLQSDIQSAVEASTAAQEALNRSQAGLAGLHQDLNDRVREHAGQKVKLREAIDRADAVKKAAATRAAEVYLRNKSPDEAAPGPSHDVTAGLSKDNYGAEAENEPIVPAQEADIADAEPNERAGMVSADAAEIAAGRPKRKTGPPQRLPSTDGPSEKKRRKKSHPKTVSRSVPGGLVEENPRSPSPPEETYAFNNRLDSDPDYEEGTEESAARGGPAKKVSFGGILGPHEPSRKPTAGRGGRKTVSSRGKTGKSSLKPARARAPEFEDEEG
ncbi:hypothetical protein B0A55_02159 [Friedmanniomyces simplex]|uniref:Uncharacterized protein n=1 Tax=Friedmanniomyces simplex TaxID=329884 RepID=A0A4U0XVB0_9PEZI|nr:hypothetical protein B0A55_02159 [Friedmanniomyces simplex]